MNLTTLKSIINVNPGLPTQQYLKLFVKELRHLQHGLTPDLRNNSFLHNKLVSGCKMVPACQFACFKPSESLAGFINDLQSSIATYEELNKPQTNQTFFTDRKYYHRNTLNHQSTSHPLQKPSNDSNHTHKKRCHICRKEGCWSKNHSKEERKIYLNQYRQKLKKKVDKHIRQYAVDLETIEENNFTSDESDTESIKETIDALVLEVGSLPVSKTSNEQLITSVGYVLNAEVMANCFGK